MGKASVRLIVPEPRVLGLITRFIEMIPITKAVRNEGQYSKSMATTFSGGNPPVLKVVFDAINTKSPAYRVHTHSYK